MRPECGTIRAWGILRTERENGGYAVFDRLQNRAQALLDRTIDRTALERRLSMALALGVIVLALLGVWWWVASTGGTRGPYLHAAYLPVLFAAVAFGLPTTILVALAATIVVGPLMPLDVETGEPQARRAWLYRGAFFVGIGGFVAVATSLLRARAERSAELRHGLADTYSRNLKMFAGLVESRDEQTHGHCDRVARNGVAIGRRLGLDGQSLGRLYWAGLLHDLGKIGVPEAILHKPGPLTDEEFAEVKKHCELGRTILLNVSDHFAPIADGVHAHHERWDGKGYPRGLSGDAIPLFGRIVAAADVFEALTSRRPYRDPLATADARRVIEEGRGTHFDPAVVDAFLVAVEHGEIGFEADTSPFVETPIESILQPDGIGMDLLVDPWLARRSGASD